MTGTTKPIVKRGEVIGERREENDFNIQKIRPSFGRILTTTWGQRCRKKKSQWKKYSTAGYTTFARPHAAAQLSGPSKVRLKKKLRDEGDLSKSFSSGSQCILPCKPSTENTILKK